MASVFFCQRLGDDLRLDLLFDVHLAQPRILRLKLFHLRHQRHVHAAVLAAPVVERCRADAQLAADLRHGNARLRPLERFHDLAVCELRLLHCVELPLLEILLLISLTDGADYPPTGSATTNDTAAKAEPASQRRWNRRPRSTSGCKRSRML